MAFRFSLATVLRYRDSVEKREEIALQKLLMEIARTRLQIEQLTREIAHAQESLNKALQQPISAVHLRSMIAAVNFIVDRRTALIESLVPLERQREIQMQAYQAAHRDRKMLSEMAIRQRDSYEQERARREQKFVDDIFAARARRS